MKKLLLFGFLFFSLCGVAQYNYMEIFDIAPISHDQYAFIPQEAVNGDYVVDSMRVNTCDSTMMGATSWTWAEVSGDTDGAFTVASNGLVTVSDATKLAGSESYDLVCSVNNETRSNSYTLTIYVAPTDSCKYIDLDAVSNGTGTKASPYNTIDLSFTTGYYYFVKRGTDKVGVDFSVINSGNPTKWITIAAYGTGEAPILDGDGTTTDGCVIGNQWDPETEEVLWTKKVRIFDLYLLDYNGSGSEPFHTSPGSAEVEFHRCTANGSSGNGGFYLHWGEGPYTRHQGEMKIIDCVSLNSGTSAHAYKIDRGGTQVINCVGINCSARGFQITGSNVGSEFYYNYIRDCYSINIRGPLNAMYWTTCRDMLDNVIDISQQTETTPHPDSVVIKNTLANMGNSYQYGLIRFQEDVGGAAWTSHLRDSVINTVITYETVPSGNANYSAVRFQSDANYCVVDGLYINGSSGGYYSGVTIVDANVTNTKLQNVVGTNLEYSGVYITDAGAGNKIYNSTFYGNAGTSGYDINNSSGTSVELKNTMYQTTDGSFSAATNLDVDGITLGDYFTDYSNGDFSLLSTATSAIDQGTNGLTTTDILGNAAAGSNRDIGAYEFIVPQAAHYIILNGINRYVHLNGINRQTGN